MFAIRQARFADALALAGRLRSADAREIAASWGVGAKTGLFCCLLQSDRAFAVYADGVPLALCGITDTASAGLRIGIPWLLAADELFARRRLAPLSRKWVRHLLLEYDVLTNLTDAANTAHLRWLAWCGFSPLRVHERHGALQRPFEEFYLLNDRHHDAEDSLREFLVQRPPPVAGLELDGAVRQLVDVALVLLRERSDGVNGALLAGLLGGFHDPRGWGARVPLRTRAACARLLVEIAHRQVRPGRRAGGVVEEFFAALAAVADVGSLLPERHDIERVVGALATGPAARAPEPAPFQRGDSMSPFEGLARRHQEQLTDGGRWSRLHGYRLRAVGLGVGEASRRPLGVPVHRLGHRLRDYYTGCALLAGGSVSMAALAQQRQALLRQPLPVRGLDRLLGALVPASVLAAALEAAIDERAVPTYNVDDPLDVVSAAGTAAAVLALVSRLADEVAVRVLPSLRLGIVVAGYGERHWLYRLLRARLLAAAGCDVVTLCRLLRDDVTALVLAAHFEQGLLDPVPDPKRDREWVTRLSGVVRACLEPFGPATLVDDGLAHVTDLLTPVLTRPVAHGVELAPALFVWHLAASGGLAAATDVMCRVPGIGGEIDRIAYRRALRRLVRVIDVAAVERMVGAAGGGR